MNHYQYHFPCPDGRVIDFNCPASIEDFERLAHDGIPPLALVLIVFAKTIELPDGTRQKVFSRWTKERFRRLQADYPADYIYTQCLELLTEYWAGYDFRNPIGLLIHRITRNAVDSNPL